MKKEREKERKKKWVRVGTFLAPWYRTFVTCSQLSVSAGFASAHLMNGG
jgi:hypothetical protein